MVTLYYVLYPVIRIHFPPILKSFVYLNYAGMFSSCQENCCHWTFICVTLLLPQADIEMKLCETKNLVFAGQIKQFLCISLIFEKLFVLVHGLVKKNVMAMQSGTILSIKGSKCFY